MQKLKYKMMIFGSVLGLLFIIQCGSNSGHSGSTNTPVESTPETSTPETSTPETSTPETSTPETSTPGTSTPGTSTPGILPHVVVDGNVTYQKINGFEATILATMNMPDGFGAPLSAIGDQLVNDFGFRFIKIRVNPKEFEPANDDSVPLTFDWNTYNAVFAQPVLKRWFQNVKAMSDAGAQIHLSAFFPPDWMSVPSDTAKRYKLDPNYRRPDLYQEIAELLAAPLVYLRDVYNTDVESIVLWNEATDSWSSFRFTEPEYIKTVKALGRRFQTEKLPTKILIADNGFISDARVTTKSVLADPDAAPYAGGMAYHTYDGYEREEPDNLISALQGLSDDTTIAASGLELRMTEWAPTVSDPLTAALVWAKHIHNCHVYGRTSVVDLWYVGPLVWATDPSSANEDDGSGGLRWRKQIYSFKQFAKFIDPGSSRIEATLSGASDLYVTAYDHAQTGRFTIVIINRGINAEVVHFDMNNIQNLTALNVIRTSATENAADLGSTSINNNSFEYNVPEESITTFTGTH